MNAAYSFSPVTCTQAGKLDLQLIRPQRAGIILYTVRNKVLYFGLGVDARTSDLTDFAGRVNYNLDTDAMQGAIREFNEETLDIFRGLTRERLEDALALYDNHNLVIFLRVRVDPDHVCRTFANKHQQVMKEKLNSNARYLPEVSAITWLSRKQFRKALYTPGVLFSRVRNFLRRGNDFFTLL